jgi:hypothetical protein
MYGRQVVIFDEYDAKSWVYVAVTTFQLGGHEYSEVLTLRFVPAFGLPLLNDDLSYYVYKNQPSLDVVQLLSRVSPSPQQPLALGCYSQGRMGSIRPCTQGGKALPGNHHIGLAWQAMIEQFLMDSSRAGRPCRVLTCQTTDELRILGAQIPMLPCDEQLGLPPSSIVLNRSAPVVREICYGTPGYFLNLRDLAGLLSRLLSEGWLHQSSVARAMSGGVSLQRALSHPRPGLFASFGGLLGARGQITDSRMTGEELRALADEEVRDGPTLRVSLSEQLETQLLGEHGEENRHPESFIRLKEEKSESA